MSYRRGAEARRKQSGIQFRLKGERTWQSTTGFLWECKTLADARRILRLARGDGSLSRRYQFRINPALRLRASAVKNKP